MQQKSVVVVVTAIDRKRLHTHRRPEDSETSKWGAVKDFRAPEAITSVTCH